VAQPHSSIWWHSPTVQFGGTAPQFNLVAQPHSSVWWHSPTVQFGGTAPQFNAVRPYRLEHRFIKK